jgi:outer membrane protein insertion porin family/translocation and assembly module TamA
VRVEIEVALGAPVLITRIELGGVDALPADLAGEARRAIELKVGDRLDEALFHGAARDIEHALMDEGYAFAKVSERAEVSVVNKTARLEYRLTPGRPAVIGAISIQGLDELDETAVRGRLGLEKGARFSRRELEAARRRLFGLGIFSAVDIKPNLNDPGKPEVPLDVVVAVGATHAFHFGAVAELDVVRAMTGVRLGWEDRNFLGGLRHFSVDATPGIYFYPLSTEVPPKPLAAVTSGVRLEQPAIIDAPTTGFVEGNVNLYPVLYSDFAPGDNIIGFRELRTEVGAERPVTGTKIKLRASYHVQASFPFMYLGDKPEGLDTAVVLFPELVGEADWRDDPIEPRSGAYFSLATQVAFLGDADDVRLQPEMRLYGKLSRSLTLAFRGELGFLFPNLCHGDPHKGCYGDSLTQDSSAAADDPAVIRDQQLLLFRGFYSGGSSSNRGYPLNEVGPHGTLGFLVPSNVNCAVENPPERCVRPLGGLTLWEQSLELRWILSDYIGLTFFTDAADLTRERVTFRANFPHLSVGTGFRLRTPVGAARLDVALRVPYMQQVGEKELPPEEGNPETILGAPMAIHFGLGEAF